MKNSADIRKKNKDLIRRNLWTGEKNTKQGIAEITGLSVATCNTMLNEMEADGEICGVKKQLNGIGRSTMVYSVNEGHESILCIHVNQLNSVVTCNFSVLSVTGRIKEESTMEVEDFSVEKFMEIVGDIVHSYNNVSYMIIGLPAIVTKDMVSQCHVKCFNGLNLKEELAKHFDCNIHVENDMHLTAYGYFRSGNNPDDVITLTSFFEGYQPGMVNIYEGIIIKGADEIAGASGFLPFGYTPEEIPAVMRDDEKGLYVMSTALLCDIVLMNPRKILIFTNVISDALKVAISTKIKEVIPEEFVPEIEYTSNISEYFQMGLYHRALDLKLR